MSNLHRHDRLIALNSVKKALANRADLLTLGLGLPLLFLIARGWLESLPDERIQSISAGGGFLAAFGLARLALERLEYHRTDGVLAARALSANCGLLYLLMLIGPSLTVVAGFFLLMGLQDPAPWLLGMPVGVASGFVWYRLSEPSGGLAPLARLIRRRAPLFAHSVPAVFGGIAAGVVLLPLQLLLGESGTSAVTGLLSLIAGAILGGVDAATVRFMAQAGYSSSRTIMLHLRSLTAFTVPLSLLLLLEQEMLLAAIAAGIGCVILAIVATRVLAYRTYDKRLADWVSTLLLAAVAVVAIPAPFAAPIVFLLAIGWLAKRASGVTWLVA